MSESFSLRIPFESQRADGSQTQLKPGRQHFLPNFLLMSDKLSQKKSILVRPEILGLCFHSLTGYHMYSRKNLEKFPQIVQMQLSSKP